MAKVFGIYVGTPRQAVPAVLVDKDYDRGVDEILVRDAITLAAAPIGTVIQAAVLGWDTIIDEPLMDLYFAALGAGTTLALGDVTFPAALMAATATNAAGSAKCASAVPVTAFWQPLWQVLGYATLAAAQLVGAKCELLFTVAGGAATGAVAWRFKGARRI